MNIVAIGGGEMRQNETTRLDKFILELTGKENPNALFIPTASYDNEGYCALFQQHYGKSLGCQTDDLCLFERDIDANQIQQKIESADLVYVGGGHTRKLMELWKLHNVDALLKTAGERGCILSGLSAGALCWFASGQSDSESFEGITDWQYTEIDGLGLIPDTFCPHLNEEDHLEAFQSLVSKTGKTGLGADDQAAIWFNNGSYKVIAENNNATVKKFEMNQQKLKVTTYIHGDIID